MISRKHFWQTVLLTAFLSVFQACTQKANTQENTIRFVTWKPNQPAVWEEAIGRFHERYPNIRVIREIGPHSATEYHDLLTQKLKNGDSSVDVFFMDVVWPPEFSSAGWALPLDEYFTQQERMKFLDAPLLANTFQNRIYGVPFWISGGLLYYRKDLLDKYGFSPPSTWEEMLQQIGAVLDAEKKNHPDLKGYSAQFKQYEGLVCNMLELVMSGKGTLVDPEKMTPFLSKTKAVEAVRFVRDEIIGKAAPRGVLTYQEPESLDLFVQGGAVFHRNWPYAWEAVNNAETSKIAGKVGISALPHFEGGRSYSALGGWQFGISRYSKKPDLAWKFIAFMTSPEMQKFFAVRASQPPVRKALYEDPDVLDANPHFASLKEVFLTAYPRPRTPFYPALSNILQRYFSKAVSSQDSDIGALAVEAESDIYALLEKYGDFSSEKKE